MLQYNRGKKNNNSYIKLFVSSQAYRKSPPIKQGTNFLASPPSLSDRVRHSFVRRQRLWPTESAVVQERGD